MTTSQQMQITTKALYLAIELSKTNWKIGLASQVGQNPRRRDVEAGDVPALMGEIHRAKSLFGLDPDAPVICCYEAGRDGFWIQRALSRFGLETIVVDSSSIEVNRKKRRRKTDRLDVEKLLAMLIRWHQGEKNLWSVVAVPSEADEDARRLHRELDVLRKEQGAHSARMKSLLATVGVKLEGITRLFPEWLAMQRLPNGQGVPKCLHGQLLREFERMQLVNQQIRALEQERAEMIRRSESRQCEMVRKLMSISGIGSNSSWLFVLELFAWRDIPNRKKLAALAGLTPTPYNSGDSERDQGIDKGGNKRVRRMLIEIAWGWLRFQPNSGLTRWFNERFANGKRRRRVGIVALARRLLIVLWRYLKDGEITDGFELRSGPPQVTYTMSLT